MELAGESASPRAYEVAGQLIKSVADTTDKLADLQKKVKDLDEDGKKDKPMLQIMLCLSDQQQISRRC